MSTPQRETTNLRIIELTAENVKRLKAVTIRPNGNTIVIGGRNGQGKSSTLDAIAYALGGKTLIPDQPIRKGETSAKVRVDLGELVVERRFTASGSTLAVMSKDGAKYPSPQSILDKLVGDLSFDPLAFATMKPEQQLQTLKKVVGVSFDDLEVKRRELYDERTLVNRSVKQLEGEIASLPFYEDVPVEPVSVDTLLLELRQAEEHNKGVSQLSRDHDNVEAAIKRADTEIDLCNGEIADLQKRFEALNQRKAELKVHRAGCEKQLAEYELKIQDTKPADTAPILSNIQQVESINEKVRDNQRRQSVNDSLTAKRIEAERLTTAIAEIDQQKELRLAAANFPVPGLSFSESGVLLNGLPFEQASQAESIRVSVAMGMAINPKLKVLLIRDASLLDEDNLALMTQLAEAGGAQLWMERVGKGKECSVVIEDGEVAEAI